MTLDKQSPPQILQIYRDFVKPGSETAYQQVEDDATRICARLGCPHPYLGVESVTGAKEVWFLNGYASHAEQEQVEADYGANAGLLAALADITQRKQDMIGPPVNVFANFRPDLSHGDPWILGRGRFLVITVAKNGGETNGTVFEMQDGTQLAFSVTQTLEEAQDKATTGGPDAKVFAVRPTWSIPAKEWVTADPEFWKSPPETKP